MAAIWQQPAHDDTASAIGGGRYAMMLAPSELEGATTVQFTRRYLDRPVGVAGNDGWESTPAGNHLVRLNPPES